MPDTERAEEYFDVVDPDDAIVGRATRREVHARGLLHRAVHALVFNRSGELFLQKRSRNKDTAPGAWDSSASGHVDAGEDYDGCVRRELREEIGLEPIRPPARWLRLPACEETGWEFVWVYRAEAEGPFTLHPEEIEGGAWCRPADIARRVREQPEEFASSFRLIWRELAARGRFPGGLLADSRCSRSPDSGMNEPIPRTKHRILVIDDNPAIHEDFRKILFHDRRSSSNLDAQEAELFGLTPLLGEQSEFEIDSAFQGEAGLARVYHAIQEGRPYVLAFVDVRMPPGWDGIEVTPKLWVADPDLPVVICTAYSDYTWEEMFARLGTSDRMFILKKPFDREEVLQIAHTLTTTRRTRRGGVGRKPENAVPPTPGGDPETMKNRLREEIAELKPVRRESP